VLSFPVSDAVLLATQAALVALPHTPPPPRLRRLMRPAWALVPAGSIAVVIGVIAVDPDTANLLTWLALVATPLLASAALAVLIPRARPAWAPAAAVLLAAAWASPNGSLARQATSLALTALGCLLLGALTDRLVRWPRGPLVPAAITITAYAADLALGSQLIVRSLLGANPRSGVRFYGLGNELESSLTLLLLVGLGALLWGQPPSRRNAAIIASAGAVFAVIVGSGRLGADVGGVITIGAGFAAAAVLMLPGTPSRRTLLLAAAVPFAALVALAALKTGRAVRVQFDRERGQAFERAA
jgi:hypothetical protein